MQKYTCKQTAIRSMNTLYFCYVIFLIDSNQPHPFKHSKFNLTPFAAKLKIALFRYFKKVVQSVRLLNIEI